MTLARLKAGGSGSGTAFGVVVGIFIGVLVGALVFPKHRAIVAVTGQGSSSRVSAGASANSTSNGAPSAAVGSSSNGASGASGASGIATPGAAGAAGSAGGATPGTPGATSPQAAAGGATARGVSANVIKIGVTYADLTALRTLGPEYDNGNVPQQWDALHHGWVKSGLLPVNGRDIQFVYKSYNVLNLADQRAACASLIQDSGVFAVIGVAYYSVGASCVAREYRTPLLTSDGPGADAYQLGWPFLFSLDESADRTLENMLYWADARGALKGKHIGLYYANDGIQPQLVDRAIRPTLAHLGYKLAAESTTSAQDTNGGPEDAIAVQRFHGANVNLAILLTSKNGFLQAANAQGYKPTFIDSDYLYGTSDTATSTYPASEWDGTAALTSSHRGESAAGIPLTPQQEACLQNYDSYSGKKVPRPGGGGHEAAVFAYVLVSCDEGGVLLDGIRAAGPGLTMAGLVAAWEAVHGRVMLRYSNVTFSPTRHDGVDNGRTLVWRAKCTCYVADGPFMPLTVR